MCGIIGYAGKREVVPVLFAALKRMEYRGYDSAGIAVLNSGGLIVEKDAGKVSQLERQIATRTIQGVAGIGHTRWATHGVPNRTNAHPHTDDDGRIALVHNGIIENYSALRTELTKKGHTFRTETDTEVLAHLIREFYHGDLMPAVRQALALVQGTYGLAIVSADEPGRIVAARMGSPMIIGHGDGENFVASDAAAFLHYTRDVTYMEDGEIAAITRDGIEHRTLADMPVDRRVEQVTYDVHAIEKGGYPHFMLKEICEQPATIADSM
ncbi:MAG: glutamine--fructose-6-phosphate aminotransferase, partial [bacterium]|nr:glutamine--fructose-6-phosphate aminotransferase [bacterium]